MYLRALLLWYLMRTGEGEFFGSDQFKTNVNVLEKGVHNLYNGATKICDFVHRKVISDYYKDLGLVPSEKSDGVNWHEVAKYFIGYLILSSLLLLLAVCVPIIFSIICCCRSRGRCGRDNKPREKERDRFVRFVCSSSLFTVTIAACICLFFAFTSNDILSTKISEPNGILSKSITNLRKMANYRDNVINDLLNIKNQTLTIAFKAKRELDGMSYRRVFEDSTDMKAIYVKSKYALAISQRIHENFYKFKDAYQSIHNLSRQVKEHLLNVTVKNQTEACPYDLHLEEIATNVTNFIESSIDTMVNVRNDLSDTIEEVFEYRNSLKKNFSAAFQAYDRIIEEVDEGIKKVLLVDQMVLRLRNLPLNRTISMISNRPWSDIILQYEYMRFGTSLGTCLLLIAILIIFFLSVFIPCLCMRKTRKQKFISAEIAGSCLVLGTGLGIFTFSLSLGLIIVLFLSGGVTYSEVCRYTQPSISNLKNTPLGNVIDAVINERILKGTPVYGIAVTDALHNCKKNVSIYEALNIESVLHLNDYFNDGNQIHRIGNLYEELGKGIIPLDISRIYPARHKSKNFIETLGQLQGGEKLIWNFGNWLHKSRVCLKTAYESEKDDELKLVIRRKIDYMRNSLPRSEFKNLTKDLSVVSKVIEDMNNDLDNQVEAISNFEKTMAHIPIKKFYELAKLKFPMNAIKKLIFSEMGRCGILYSSINELVEYGCTEIVQVLNAFWVALGISLLLLLLSFAATTSLVVLNRRKGKNSQCYKELNNPPDSPIAPNRINRRTDKKSKLTKSSDMLLLTPNPERIPEELFIQLQYKGGPSSN